MRRTRDEMPKAPGPVHHEIERYLEAVGAVGWDHAIPRAQLRAHLEEWSRTSHGGQWLGRFAAKGFDREMRALMGQCNYLKMRPLSAQVGYYNGRAHVRRDWALAIHGLHSREIYLRKRQGWIKGAYAATVARDLTGRVPTQRELFPISGWLRPKAAGPALAGAAA